MFVYVAECNLIISVFSLTWKHGIAIHPLAFTIKNRMGQMFTFKAVFLRVDTHTSRICECQSCPQACGTFPKAWVAQEPNVDISGVFCLVCTHRFTHTMSHTQALIKQMPFEKAPYILPWYHLTHRALFISLF